jgi:hypothetical protein
MTEDFLDIDGAEQREKIEQAAHEVASHYVVFVTDERARKLLEMWDAALLNRRTPVDAPITQYAANEALRAFVAGIHDQIRLATTPRGNT